MDSNLEELVAFLMLIDPRMGWWIWRFMSWAITLVVGLGTAVSAGAQTNAAIAARPMSRAVEVVAKRTSPVRGITATGTVNITGTFFADSYDSSKGPYDPLNPSGNAFVGTTSKTYSDFMVSGTAKVIGQIGTGAPDVLKFTGGGTASVGSESFVEAGLIGVESGCLQDDLNVSIDSVILPFNPVGAPAPTMIPLTELGLPPRLYTNIYLTTGNYSVTDLILTTNMFMYVQGDAVLNVRNFQVAGGALTVESNASFNVYFSRTIKLNSDTVTNKTMLSGKLCFYGLSGATAVTITGARVYAYIYAPTAQLSMAGTSELFGASITQSVSLSGTSSYHYDEALLRQNYKFVPIAWKEL